MGDTRQQTDRPNPTRSASPLWDDWDTPPRIPDSPTLHLDGFDGPLDLLLDLAERQRIDLGRISVLQLAEQFLTGLAQFEAHVPLERRGDWLVVATRLVLLRSRFLCPTSPEDAAQAAQEEEAEAERLQHLLFVRAATAWLSARPLLGRDVFARPSERNPRVTSYMALMEACLTVLRGGEELPGAAAPGAIALPAAAFRMDIAMARIRALLGQRGTVPFEACLPTMAPDDSGRALRAQAAVASSFAAVLELARQGDTVAEQEGSLSPIMLTAVGNRALAPQPGEI